MNRVLFPTQKICHSLGDIATDMEQVMDHLFGEDRSTAGPQRGFSARLDIVEQEDSFDIVLDLPGVDSENVNVEIDEDTLVVSGNRETKSESSKGTYHCSERRSGKFERRVRLPKTVDREKIEANFDKGVLTWRFPSWSRLLRKRSKLRSTKFD